jgi:hypothetical protein
MIAFTPLFVSRRPSCGRNVSTAQDTSPGLASPLPAVMLARDVLPLGHEEVTMRIACCTLILVAALALPAHAQLAADWMVAAAAHTPGVGGTFWRTDLSIHNPHQYDLPVWVQLLPSDTVNWDAYTLQITLYPWETINLWDALAPDLLDQRGTAALMVYADPSLACDPIEDCQFLVTSRTYTPDPRDSGGEFAQTIPGVDYWQAVDWTSYGYAAGILNDGELFRCNIGVASWSPGWTVVRVDVQDSSGNILASHELQVPPFGHVQRRLATAVEGGSLVFYLVDGPDDARVFPYASVVDQTTGDPSYQRAIASTAGVAAAKSLTEPSGRPAHPVAVERRPAAERLRTPRGAGAAVGE